MEQRHLLAIAGIKKEFTLSKNRLIDIKQLFEHEVEKANQNQSGSLNGTGYYLPKPSGRERGRAIALDLGGTGVRAFLLELNGQGGSKVLMQISLPLRSNKGEYDYISEHSQAEQLFDFQVQILAALIAKYPQSKFPLGYIFSYPVKQTQLNEAVLIRWSKEIRTPGVEGQEVMKLLKQALIRFRLEKRIIPLVVFNDTIGTFMASAYVSPYTNIGSVIGTGFNTCYLEPNWQGTGEERIINLECGNFDKVPVNRYDELLDRQSSYPGQQKLEKMTSGQYLGELFRLAAVDILNIIYPDVPPGQSELFQPYSITTSELSLIIADRNKDCSAIKQWWWKRFATTLDSDICRSLQDLAKIISRRSANLIAATYAAIINHVDCTGKGKHLIAINGSLYEKMPGFKDMLNSTLNEILGIQTDRVKIKLCQAGPALGAAVAACRMQDVSD